MFNLSGSEIVFLLMAGLVVLGPERLPGVIRKVGRTYAQVRRTLTEYERDFRETFKEPLDEVRSTVKDIKASFGTVDTTPSPPMRPETAENPPVAEPPTSSPFSNARMSASPDRWRSDTTKDGQVAEPGDSERAEPSNGAPEDDQRG